jgi:CubicO group peptidase (beta-lactamase class C family)
MVQKRVALIVLSMALLLPACAPAQGPGEQVVIEPAELQSFADAFFPKQMKALDIPGLAFVFVQAGEVIYAQGYGHADLETETPVDADSTVMRIGSVSKLFVATAVMQLVEQGRLDLHTDINRYLTAFALEENYPEPVTLAHLLTHTAGFEDPPYTSTHPPGEVFIYSNYGYALAALVVEEVSGTPFDHYVDQNIFQPLGMTHSSYLLAPPLPENMAAGYEVQEGVQVPQPMDYDSDYPGGSIVSTAEDMSHFLLAQLGDGCFRGACILQTATLAEMHRAQAATPYEGQNATFGFVEATADQVRLIGHSGAIRGFASNLNLLPEHNMGYFFAFNEECYQTSACQILFEFRQQFLKRFF